MTKKIWFSLLLLLFLLPGDLFAACVVTAIPQNSSTAGNWGPACTSTHRTGHYAQYFTFTLASSQQVTIGLDSSTDPYLILLNGSGENGTVIKEDDDGGAGANSKIVISLAAGTYTVEATTYAPSATGSFTVSLTVGTVPPGACGQLINPNSTTQDSWSPGCTSTHRAGRYAKYFTFSLPVSRQVTIDLVSTTDPYLILLNGPNENGTIIREDDDGGAGSNARIVRVLQAGSYTIEATTYEPAVTGAFTVSVATSSTCSNCPFEINAGLNDAWYSSATDGQGMTITVLPQVKQIFVAWFTFDTVRPPANVTANLGGPGQRWLTAQGPYSGNKATLKIYVTKGGVFDSAVPATTTNQAGDGTLVIEFADCTEAMATYHITSLNISGEIPLERVVLDNVPLCEALANP